MTEFEELINKKGLSGELKFRNPNLLYGKYRFEDQPFLLIKKYIEIPVREFSAMEKSFKAPGIVVSFRVTKDWGLSWRKRRRNLVRFALAEDVVGFSRKEMDAAITEQRILWISSYREFGDTYLDLRIVTHDSDLKNRGYFFLFDVPYHLKSEELPDTRLPENWLWSEEGLYDIYINRLVRESPIRIVRLTKQPKSKPRKKKSKTYRLPPNRDLNQQLQSDC